MIRLFLLLVAVVGCASACGEAEKQWYKPGVDYTVADFQRDRSACEKSGTLDEDCLKQRGWRPLTPDKGAATPAPTPTPRGGTRY